MRLLTSTAVLSCACAAVLSGAVAGAPAAKPRLVSNRPVETGARWIGVVSASRRPVVTARLGRRSQTVTVRRFRSGRYQLRAIFRQAGRWALWAARQRFGSVLVRQASLRLTNAMDVVVEPSGSMLVSDFSDRVFRLNGDRLTLLAGNGRPGHTGDGGPAVRAAIGFPVEIAVDPRGGFGIVHGEQWVRHVDPSGTISTVAEFQQPTALAYDSAGNLFVSELLGGVKRRDAATGAVTTYAGFNRPHGLAVAADGTVYVADTFNNRVQRISPGGSVTTLADGINQPNDVALGPDGNIYATEWGSSRILRITPTGVATRIADSQRPSSVAVGGDGTVYVTEERRGAVRRITVANLAAFKPARAGAAWTGTLVSKRRPGTVTARNGVTTQAVAVWHGGRNRYRLRTVFPFSGRWQLLAGRRRLGVVSVRPEPALASALPTAQAFRLCGGTGSPYPQYALSRDPGTGALWASCRQQARLHRISPASGETRAILRLTSTPYAIAAGLGAVWSAERGPIVNRIDLRTGRGATAVSGGGFSYIWTAAGSVWAADDEASALMRYDPSGRRVVATIPTGSGTSALAEDAGRIWIVNHRDGTLQRIDPATNTSTALGRLPGEAPERMTYAEGSLWVTGRGTDLLCADPATGAIQATIDVGAGAIDVAAAAHSIWVAVPTDEADRQGNPFLDRLLRVDPATKAVVETLRPTARIVVNGLASTGNALWIADTAGGRLYRVTR
jgi:sugar lactone lactonase YvrE